MPRKDRDARLAYGREHYRLQREEVLAARVVHYAENADRIRAERALKRNAETRARASELQRARYRALRAEIIAAYGGKCDCCGEAEPTFLELDHATDDGAAHRKEIGRGSHATYKVVKQAGFPRDKFRLLCANCNQGRQRNGGICPHQQQEARRA